MYLTEIDFQNYVPSCHRYEIIHHSWGDGKRQRLSNFLISDLFFGCQFCNLELLHNCK